MTSSPSDPVEKLLAEARAIADSPGNISYPSRVAATHVRGVMRRLLALFDAKPVTTRNELGAAARVATMTNADVVVFAERDPDIFRDVAIALSASDKARESTEARIAQLEGRLCLICGEPEPCALKDDEFSPCTFDPSPIDAARQFLTRATKAEARLREAERMLAEADAAIVALQLAGVHPRFLHDDVHLSSPHWKSFVDAGTRHRSRVEPKSEGG